VSEPNLAELLSTDEQQFRVALRRRNRWGVATACSGGLAISLAFVGMETSSTILMLGAGCAFIVAGVSVGQVTANGYLAPSFGASVFRRESVREHQYRAAFVLVLWGIFCIVVAFHLK
jgi:hypothetical protein